VQLFLPIASSNSARCVFLITSADAFGLPYGAIYAGDAILKNMVVALNQNDSSVGLAQSVNTATNPSDPAIAAWFAGNAPSPTTVAAFQAASSIYPGFVPTAAVATGSAAASCAANALLALLVLAVASLLR